MKKLKTILALMLAMLIMCFSVSTAFASQNDVGENLYEQIEGLHNLCMTAVNVFGASAKDDNYSHKPGMIYLSVSNLVDINNALDKAIDIIYRYGYPMIFENYNGVTEQEIQTAYDNLETAMNSATIEKSELETLIEFCLLENNNNKYYPQELWSDYENSIIEGQRIVSANDVTGEEYNCVYWDMLYNFNKLCIVNQTYGDIDFNGKITILDATTLQRILAQLDDTNSSILHICNLNITYATEIQRYLASLVDSVSVPDNNLEYLSTNIECSNYDSQKWYFNSWRMNYLFMEYVGSHC